MGFLLLIGREMEIFQDISSNVNSPYYHKDTKKTKKGSPKKLRLPPDIRKKLDPKI